VISFFIDLPRPLILLHRHHRCGRRSYRCPARRVQGAPGRSLVTSESRSPPQDGKEPRCWRICPNCRSSRRTRAGAAGRKVERGPFAETGRWGRSEPGSASWDRGAPTLPLQRAETARCQPQEAEGNSALFLQKNLHVSCLI